MIKIVHRVNTINFLKKIPKRYGVEIDLRAFGNKVILNHEPFVSGELLEDYFKYFSHAFAIFNIKEAGIEEEVLRLAHNYKIDNFFLLDVEAPYLYRASRKGLRNMAIRYSEVEPIEALEYYRGYVDWVWIDTVSELPLSKEIIEKLKGFKTCLVCPERWGRPQDIHVYQRKMKALGFEPEAVMTAIKYINKW